MADLRYEIIERELQAGREEFLEFAAKLYEDTKKKILHRIGWSVKDQNPASAPRNMKLLFTNKIPREIFTGKEIRGQGENPLEVTLVYESSGDRVAVEPESSATVEILLLKGESNGSDGDNWTVEQFKRSIVPETVGMEPLLAGNQRIKLQNGIGLLLNIKFRSHATKMRPSVFKLGARVIDTFHGVSIKEAETECFAVKDYRNQYGRKHDTPSLLDDVCRLKNIGKKRKQRLHHLKICNVKDFLIRRLRDPEGLKNIVKMAESQWEITVEHALLPSSDEKMSYHANKHGVVFDLSGQILGQYMEREYTPINMLCEKRKADAENYLQFACKNWEKVEPFKDENSVQHHLNDVGGHENTQTCEMNSPMISQTGVGDCSFLRIDYGEFNANAFAPDGPIHSPNIGVTPSWNVDEFPDQFQQ